MASNISAQHKIKGRDRTQFLLLALFYGIGAVLCLYLFWLGFAKEGENFCELLRSDCLSVISSDFGTLRGFPVASYGAAYFFMQIGILFTARYYRPTGGGKSWLPLLPGNLLAMTASLFFIYVMQTLIKEACIFCYAVHGVNFLSLALLFALFRQNNLKENDGGLDRHAGGWAYGTPLLLALTVFFGINLFATQKQLVAAQKTRGENLSYFQYLYRTSPLHPIAVTADDEVIGDPEVAIHQIVLVYKEGCRHCLAAREKLTTVVRNYPEGVYLVLKNYRNVSVAELDKLGISRAPAVFINGKRAEGWDISGFLDEYTVGCDC